MKKLIFVLPFILLLGCAPTETVVTPEPTEVNIEEIKEQLKEEIKEEVKEEIKAEEEAKAKEITIDNYDYKTDPDTLVVNINDDNLFDYIDLQIIQETDGNFLICTHSLMYDKGYVVVGTENCTLIMYVPGLDAPVGSGIFTFKVPMSFTSEEEANKYLENINDFTITLENQDATIYYQKLEDVKFGYKFEGGLRVVNGEETFCWKNCPY